MKRKFKILFSVKINLLFLIFLISSTGCNNYYELRLEKKNPITYCFDANIQQVKKAISISLGSYTIPGLALYFKNDSTAISKITSLLNKAGNENDSFLETFLEPLKSNVYFKDNEPLLYEVEFHLHIDSLRENKTQVTVKTLKSEIYTGLRPGIGDNLTIGVPYSATVTPSTIEEYEILLRIGTQLGQNGMPPCNYPSKNGKRIKKWNIF